MVSPLFSLLWWVVSRKYQGSDPLLSVFVPHTLYLGYSGVSPTGLSKFPDFTPFSSANDTTRHKITNYGFQNVYQLDLTGVDPTQFSNTFEIIESVTEIYQRIPEDPATILNVFLNPSELPNAAPFNSITTSVGGLVWNVRVLLSTTLTSGDLAYSFDTQNGKQLFVIEVPHITTPTVFNSIIFTNADDLPISFHVLRVPISLTYGGEYVDIRAHMHFATSFVLNPENAASGEVNIFTQL